MSAKQGRQAVILAGGAGTRLRPYTTVLPKPLMPIGEWPVLEVILRQLKRAGFDRIIVTTGYLSHLLEAYFGDGSRWGVEITYSHEDSPLGTAGPLALLDDLDENLLVMNGDLLTDLDYGAFWDAHCASDALATIAVCEKNVPISLGVLETDGANQVRKYIEKPTYSFQVSMGVYAYRREIIAEIPQGEYFDFPNLIQKLIGQNQSVAAHPFSGIWFDIGRAEDYEEAQEQFESLQPRLLPEEK